MLSHITIADMTHLTYATPCSNTGLDSLATRSHVELHIDALSLLWDETDFDILSLTKNLLGVRFDLTVNCPRKIGVFWDYVYRSANGSLYSFRRTPNGLSYRMALSGTDCSAANPDLMLHFIHCVRLNIPTLRCSRIDFAADDYSKSLSPDQMMESIDAGTYSGFSKGSYIKNFGEDGFTVNIGRRTSEYFARYYDKHAESHGRIDAYRYESEIKGDQADFVFKILASEPTTESATRSIKKLILGKINFYDHKDKNLCRNTLADWWVKFVARITDDRTFYVPVKPVTSIESKIAWITRQVSKSLATISACFGDIEFGRILSEIMAIGTDKMQQHEYNLILDYEFRYAGTT